MVDLVREAFANPFITRAALQMLLLAALGGVAGTHVVLRRLAFVTDALHHTVFPGIVIAYLLQADLLVGAVVAAAVTVVALTLPRRWRGLDRDGLLALSVAFAFALGVVLVSRSSSYQHDLTVLLFGRILDVSARDIVETALITVVALGVLALLHKELVLAAFDPTGAEAAGYLVRLLDLLVHAVVALVVVASVRSVGTVLVVAFIVTPAATGRLMTRSVGGMMTAATVVSALCGVAGLLVSYDLSVHRRVNLPSGATVVVFMSAAFLLSALVRVSVRAAGRWRRGSGGAADVTADVPAGAAQ